MIILNLEMAKCIFADFFRTQKHSKCTPALRILFLAFLIGVTGCTHSVDEVVIVEGKFKAYFPAQPRALSSKDSLFSNDSSYNFVDTDSNIIYTATVSRLKREITQDTLTGLVEGIIKEQVKLLGGKLGPSNLTSEKGYIRAVYTMHFNQDGSEYLKAGIITGSKKCIVHWSVIAPLINTKGDALAVFLKHAHKAACLRH